MTDLRLVGRGASVALAVSLCAGALAACEVPHHAHRDMTIRTRTLPWPGGDRLIVGTSADVRYIQGAASNVVITGPADDIDDIVVDDGVIRHEHGHWRGWWDLFDRRTWERSSQVRIVVTAPQIADAGVGGSGHLDLGKLTQDRLGLVVSGSGALDVSGQFKTVDLSVSGSGEARLDQVTVGDLSARLSGSGEIKAAGAADMLHLGVSGSGVADLGQLTAQEVDAHLSGSGSAQVSPKQSADVDVSGSGAVHMLTQPAQLHTHRSGSGSISGPNGGS